MKYLSIFILILLCPLAATAQGELPKIVDAEHEFARSAAKIGTKAAFLQFMTEDALVFVPERVNAPEHWKSRPAGPGLLSWAPNFADISANGLLGYTTGNFEFRPKGEGTDAVGFGDFITVWQRQADGTYKWVIDIGVSHDRPAKYSTEWTTSKEKKDTNEKGSSAGDAAYGFFQMLVSEGAAKAYGTYATEDVRGYRENMQPFLGRKSLTSYLKSEKGKLIFAKRSSFFGTADLAYNLNTYTRTLNNAVVEKGNVLQIWKLVDGKWKIVLDILKPVPQK